MINFRNIILAFIIIVFSGCSSGEWESPTGDTTDPYVISVSPPNGSPNVSLTAEIVVYFSKDIDSSTLSGNFYLSPGISGTLYYDVSSRAAIIVPSGLASNTTYTAIVTNGVRDTTGRRLLNGYEWYFQTAPQMMNLSSEYLKNETDISQTQTQYYTTEEATAGTTLSGINYRAESEQLYFLAGLGYIFQGKFLGNPY